MKSDATFAINGRFLTQPMTGVQRYARNVLSAMDQASRDDAAKDRAARQGSGEVRLLVPLRTEVPALQSLSVTQAGSLRGHAWEQCILPGLHEGRLLNLCNTAPIAKRDQIICIHDANVFVSPDSYSVAFRSLYRSLQPLLARRATRVTTVSHASARQISRYLQIAERDIVVLPNGHEHALSWDPEKSDLDPKLLAQIGRRPFILAIGSRARHKNLALLHTIAPHLAEAGVDIVVAGGGNDIFTGEQLAQAANVHLIGRVTDDDLALLMHRALCLAFPSWTEGFGLPVLEAMARGCAVISSDRASMPEVCGDAAVLAPPDDPATWVKHVKALLGSPAMRDDYAARGRARAAAFSWSQTAAAYLDLLAEPTRRQTAAATVSAPAIKSRVAVVVATRGRPKIVDATVRYLLATQTLKPELTIISCADRTDAGELDRLPGVKVITGPAGLPAQRNSALAALPAGLDMVAFFDDDFVAERNWLGVAARAFSDEPALAGFTGQVLIDDIKGPGLTFDEAVAAVEGSNQDSRWTWIEPYSPYGCNMAFRAPSIAQARFDERLVLYGWLEDRDFAANLTRHGGRLVKCALARGVHMGVKSGRVQGDRLGYSQISNPIYMLGKGTMTISQVADHIFRNFTSNLVLSFRPEPFIDRRGRLRGNLIGIADILRGRVEPERAASIQPRRGA